MKVPVSCYGFGREGVIKKPGIVEKAVWKSFMVPQIGCMYPFTLASLRA